MEQNFVYGCGGSLTSTDPNLPPGDLMWPTANDRSEVVQIMGAVSTDQRTTRWTG